MDLITYAGTFRNRYLKTSETPKSYTFIIFCSIENAILFGQIFSPILILKIINQESKKYFESSLFW